MSTDKLQTVRFTLNEILSEAAASPSTYFDEEAAPAPVPKEPTEVEPALEPAALRVMREWRRYPRRRRSHCSPILALTRRSASAGRCATSEASERNGRRSAKTI